MYEKSRVWNRYFWQRFPLDFRHHNLSPCRSLVSRAHPVHHSMGCTTSSEPAQGHRPPTADPDTGSAGNPLSTQFNDDDRSLGAGLLCDAKPLHEVRRTVQGCGRVGPRPDAHQGFIDEVKSKSIDRWVDSLGLDPERDPVDDAEGSITPLTLPLSEDCLRRHAETRTDREFFGSPLSRRKPHTDLDVTTPP
jgi:hypothetical protein